MGKAFLLSRYACGTCGREWETVKSRRLDVPEYPEGIDVYNWTKCPDHPDAKGRLLCAICGDRSLRCSVNGCQVETRQHTFERAGDGAYLLALCEAHRNGPAAVFSKHYSGPYSDAEAEAFVAAQG